MMNWGHPENEAVPFGSVKPVWGNPTPENYDSQMPSIPCIGIARVAGLELKRLCAETTVEVVMQIGSTNSAGTDPDQYLFIAHLFYWHTFNA